MESIREKISDINPNAVLWDGLDNAIVGLTEGGKVVYDIELMYNEIHKQNKEYMDYDEAIEWVEFNIINSYVGEYTPLHIWGMRI